MGSARQRRRQRRRKERERRAAARRLPPVHGNPGRLSRGGRPTPVRVVGVGQFAQGLARRRRPAPGGRTRRLGGVVLGLMGTAALVLWIVARVSAHG